MVTRPPEQREKKYDADPIGYMQINTVFLIEQVHNQAVIYTKLQKN